MEQLIKSLQISITEVLATSIVLHHYIYILCGRLMVSLLTRS